MALAEQRWPDEPKSALLTRLILSGAATLEAAQAGREEALDAMAKYADCYPPGYLRELRLEWER